MWAYLKNPAQLPCSKNLVREWENFWAAVERSIINMEICWYVLPFFAACNWRQPTSFWCCFRTSCCPTKEEHEWYECLWSNVHSAYIAAARQNIMFKADFYLLPCGGSPVNNASRKFSHQVVAEVNPIVAIAREAAETARHSVAHFVSSSSSTHGSSDHSEAYDLLNERTNVNSVQRRNLSFFSVVTPGCRKCPRSPAVADSSRMERASEVSCFSYFGWISLIILSSSWFCFLPFSSITNWISPPLEARHVTQEAKQKMSGAAEKAKDSRNLSVSSFLLFVFWVRLWVRSSSFFSERDTLWAPVLQCFWKPRFFKFLLSWWQRIRTYEVISARKNPHILLYSKSLILLSSKRIIKEGGGRKKKTLKSQKLKKMFFFFFFFSPPPPPLPPSLLWKDPPRPPPDSRFWVAIQHMKQIQYNATTRKEF